MPRTMINGLQMYWELTGDTGDSLVLVHGSWGDHHNWDRVVPQLARLFQVLTYDRRGHSQSERPSGQGSVNEDVADLAALIEMLGLAPAHILGHSLGASLVLRLAGQRPDVFRSLIVQEPPLLGLLSNQPELQATVDADQRRISFVVERLRTGDMAGGAQQFVDSPAHPGFWAHLPLQVQQTWIFNAPTFLDEMQDPEIFTLNLRALSTFSHPALLMMSDPTTPFAPHVLAQLVGVLPRCETKIFSGAGPTPYLSQPDEYVRTVTTFVKKATASPS